MLDEILIEQDGSIYVGGKPLHKWVREFNAARGFDAEPEAVRCEHVPSFDPRRAGKCAKCGCGIIEP